MFVIRHRDLVSAIEPERKLVKIAEPELWKPEASMGPDDWRAGTEIRCDRASFSVFRTGAAQTAHYHESSWEMYQVLRGKLRIAVRPNGSDGWNVVALGPLDVLWLPPKTPHFVDSSAEHLSQVIQTPPAGDDKVALEPEQAQRARDALIKGT